MLPVVSVNLFRHQLCALLANDKLGAGSGVPQLRRACPHGGKFPLFLVMMRSCGTRPNCNLNVNACESVCCTGVL